MRLAKLTEDDGFLDMDTGAVYTITEDIDGEADVYRLRVLGADGENYSLADLSVPDNIPDFADQLRVKLQRLYNYGGI